MRLPPDLPPADGAPPALTARRRRVVVVGGGIGGLAAATALHRSGHEVQVLEEAPVLRAAGGALTLWSGATAVARSLGLRVQDLGRRLERLERWDPDGRRTLCVDLAAAAGRLGSPAVTVQRSALLQHLAAGLPDGVVRTSARCTGLEDDGSRVRVSLAPGRGAPAPVEGDVVVGADGRRSAVRAALHADVEQATGWVTWQCPPLPLDSPLAAGGTCVLVVGPEGLLGLNPAGDGLVQVWADVRATPETVCPASPADMLRRRFGRWRPAPVRAALAGLEDEALVAYPRARHRVHRPWGRGRVTLLGDAAHVFPPSMAQGTNQAFEDALALHAALARPVGDVEALRSYEAASLARAQAVSQMSAREPTVRHVPAAVLRTFPDAWATALFTHWVRWTSGALRTRVAPLPV